MKIIIAEKQDVAKQIVHAIAPSASFNLVKSSSKGRVGYYENSQFVICYSVGHIVSIPTPKDISDDFDWSLAGLPWDLPADLPTVVSADKKDIFAGIQKAFSLHDYDEVIVVSPLSQGFKGDMLSTSFMLSTIDEIKEVETKFDVCTIVIKDHEIIYRNPLIEVYKN